MFLSFLIENLDYIPIKTKFLGYRNVYRYFDNMEGSKGQSKEEKFRSLKNDEKIKKVS